MGADRIDKKDFITDDTLKVGPEIAKSLQPGIDAVERWLEVIKKAAIEYQKLGSKFKAASNTKEFLQIKKEEERLSIATSNAYKAEQLALVAVEKSKQASLTTEKKLVELKQKELTVTTARQKAKQAEIETEKKLIQLNEQKRKIIESNISQKKKEAALLALKKKEAQLTEQTVVAKKEQNALELNLIKTKERLKLSTKGTNRALVKERTALQAQNKIIKQQAREQLGLAGAYEKLNLRRSKAQKQLANLLSTEKKDIVNQRAHQRAIVKTTSIYNKLNSRVLSVARSTDNYTQNIRNHRSALAGLSGSFRSLTSALGVAGGVFAFVQVMRNGIRVIQDYEKSNATLSGILQVEKKDMQALREESQRLGSETVKTAGEVVGLQIAYARLGFSQQQIIDLTGATIQGSIALNAELDRTANLTGAIVNTFDDFSASDAPKILDILALATAKSALNFEKLEKGLPIVGGAANAAGIDFTKLVALLGKLADSGIDVSSSSTALRNIFIESARQGLNYSQIIEKIKSSQDKLTTATDEFGKRAAVSASVLSNNIDSTKELDVALQGAAGTAESMANKELDTLDGALQLIKSAWQGIILETDGANNISGKMKDTLKFLAKNLKTIVSVVASVVKIWLSYKVVLFATSKIMKIYSLATVGLAAAKKVLAGGLRSATIQMKAFNLATKSNPIGLLLGVIAGGVATWLAFKDGVKSTAEELANVKKEAIEARDAIVSTNIELVKQRLKAIDEASKSEAEASSKKIEFVEEEINKQAQGIDIYKVLKDEELQQDKERSEQKLELEEALQKKQAGRKNIKIKDERELVFKDSPSDVEIKVKPVLDKTATQNTVKELKKILGDLTKTKEKAENEAAARSSKKRIKDAFELAKFSIEQSTSSFAKIAEDEKNSFIERHQALEDKAVEELKLALLVKEFYLSNEKLTADGRLLILEKFEQEKKRIADHREVQSDKLEVGALKRQSEIELLEKQKALAQELALENDAFNVKEGIYAKAENATELREKRIAEIKKKYALEALNAQVAAVEALLLSEELSAIKRAEYETKLAVIKQKISDITTDDFITKDQEEVERARKKLDKILELSQQLANALKDLADSIFEGKIQKIDAEIEKEDEKFNRQLENENLSEEERKAIEAKRDKRRQELEKKKRKEQRKQAILAKAIAALNIGLTTAQATLAALAPPPIGLGPIAGIPLAVQTAVFGALQLAAVLAKPIPKYLKGTQNHPGGLALVSEVRPEVISEPGRDPYVQSSPAILELPKGTRVTRSIEDYNRLFSATVRTSLEAENKKLNAFGVRQSFQDNLDLLNEIKGIRSDLKKKQDIYISTPKMDIDHAVWRLNNMKWD